MEMRTGISALSRFLRYLLHGSPSPIQQGFNQSTINDLISYSLRSPSPRHHHITRLSMYAALKNSFAKLDSPERRCLSISGSSNLGAVLGLTKTAYFHVDYPKYTILDLPYECGFFDFTLSDQVLEHIEGDPFTAFKEAARVTKPGGLMCHTTCFINGIHPSPKDFWRFTPDALKLLARYAGCQPLQVGQWGNKEAWALIDAGFRFTKIPDEIDHPLYKLALRNDPIWPISTWIIARKPVDS